MRYGVVEIGRGGGGDGDGDGDDDGSRDTGSLVSVCSVLMLAMLLPESARVVVEALAGAGVEAASTDTVAKDSSLLLEDVDSLGKLATEAELELDALDREMGEESPVLLPSPDERLDSGCGGR